ncbi:ADAM 17-like protease [Strongyloides ratti]|uniref:ADAM 17-like protease n=1 Tax=Strongyloides ratti TaxID=34506 RepID=A0A090MQI0_STRRB|nr:ADAM 17-like protease [Strongyloides ratti]CEF60428.1 ADAM 17-like protease [Strongyloides ratti]
MEVGMYKDSDLDIRDYQIDLIIEKTNELLTKAILSDENSTKSLIIQLTYNEIKTIKVTSKIQIITQISGSYKSGNILFTNKNFAKNKREVVGFSFGLFCNPHPLNIIGILTDVTESTFSFENVLARRILHEIGHSLNAVHDNSSENNYNIMAPLEILVEHKNNSLFSKPSLFAISKYVFEVCINFLVDINIRNCGNGILDKGEECDEGHKNFNVNFKCCNKYCKLKKTAKCCDSNHDCCLNCNIASTNISCYPKVFYQCIDESFCDGINSICPKPKYLPDNTKCMKNGAKCLNGRCVDKCKYLNEDYVHCLCEENDYRCYQCCRNISNEICKPIMGKILLEEGSICSNLNKNFRCNNESKCVYNSSLNIYSYDIKRKKWSNYYIQNIVTILFIIFLPIFIFLKARRNYYQIKMLHNNEEIMKAYRENN